MPRLSSFLNRALYNLSIWWIHLPSVWASTDQWHPLSVSQSSLVFLGHKHCPGIAGNNVAQFAGQPLSAFELLILNRQLSLGSSSTLAPPFKFWAIRSLVDVVVFGGFNKLANAWIPPGLLPEIHKCKINQYQVLIELRKHFDFLTNSLSLHPNKQRWIKLNFLLIRTNICNFFGTYVQSSTLL